MTKKKYIWLPDFVYGSIDGVVTTFAVVAGVKGAALSVPIILILGFANLFADGFSMATAKYLSDKTELEILKKKAVGINPIRGAAITFASFVLIGIIPLSAYLLRPILNLNNDQLFTATSIATLLALFIVGAVKSNFTTKHPFKSGIETAAIGGIAASIAYFVGFFIKNLLA